MAAADLWGELGGGADSLTNPPLLVLLVQEVRTETSDSLVLHKSLQTRVSGGAVGVASQKWLLVIFK